MRGEMIKRIVRDRYGKIAKQDNSCCGPAKSCCGNAGSVDDISQYTGYGEQESKGVPKGANLGLGCGNPVALATLSRGETVLDLGSGAGLDCFLAAERVGEKGKVIGVDMTPEMIDRARKIAGAENCQNVEFRLGEIENLPVADNSVDVVISNCVINLSPDKGKVFREAFRVLKPGGRLMISDIVLLKELPTSIKDSMEAYVGCVSGAIGRDQYIEAIRAAGFDNVEILDEASLPKESITNDPIARCVIEDPEVPVGDVREAQGSVTSATVYGTKPVETN